MHVKVACACCSPLVDLKLLSCHHHGLCFLENNKPLTIKRLQMNVNLAFACCRPLVDLEMLSCHHHNLFPLGKP